MFKKRRTIYETNHHERRIANLLIRLIFFVTFTLVYPHSAIAENEECDTTVGPFNSPAGNLCVPSIELERDYVLDGQRNDWIQGPTPATYTYYTPGPTSGGGANSAQFFISHKKRAFNKTDLYLFFEVMGDAVNTLNDEIRIGLNPGTTPGDSTLIKIHPWSTSGVNIEVFNYNGTNWVTASYAWLPLANIYSDAINKYWAVEMKIPLDTIPAHSITGTDFRLYLELHANDGVNTITYAWPPHYPSGLHNNICVNPERWHPMSFGTGCFPDLSIANGLYSCDAIYVLRNGVKSTEIAVNQMNEFHADVTNLDVNKNATDVQVYMTLLQLGISTAPIAMNYDHTDANIKNWFQQKWGAWLLATDKLDTGIPKPPAKFNVNAGAVDTGARFNWKPSDETRFGTPAQMFGSHKCTAAFVDYKDDPNMANNFSYCNTTIVSCPAGQTCIRSFWYGPYFAYAHPPGDFRGRFKVSAINEPYEGWFKESKFRIAGKGVEQINSEIFEAPVPKEGNNELTFEINLPKPKPMPPVTDIPPDPQKGSSTSEMMLKSVSLASEDPVKERNERLKKIYGNKPIILIEGLVPAGYKIGANEKRVQLYRVSNYVAFALDLKEPTPPPICCPATCGPTKRASLMFASIITVFGIAIIRWKVWKKEKHSNKQKGGDI